MNLDLEGVAKTVYVGFLLILWAVLVKLGIRDEVLIDVIKGLIGVIVGWHGLNRLPGYRRAATDSLPAVQRPAPPMPTVAPAATETGAQG
jgi:hypothetical protein